jgi:hypothetical protein
MYSLFNISGLFPVRYTCRVNFSSGGINTTNLLSAVLSNHENHDSWKEYLQCKVGGWRLEASKLYIKAC